MNVVEFLEQIITHLTGDKPQITTKEDRHGLLVTINATGNLPALIGRNGRTFQALKVLAKAIGYNDKHKLWIRLHDDKTYHSEDLNF
jgi:predicted RNA-binding protein Jag